MKNDAMLCVRIPEQTKKALGDLVAAEAQASKYKVTLSQVVSKIIEEYLEKQKLPLHPQHNK